MDLKIRRYRVLDLAFFRSMFYESLFVPPGNDPFPMDIIDNTALSKYHVNWGQEGDRCHIGEINEVMVGACWIRYFTAEQPGYAYVDNDIPELGIALLPEWTNKGIGSQLMLRMLNQLKAEGCRGVSLSADIRNRAVPLYERFGFEEISREGDSVVMVVYFDKKIKLTG